LTIIVRKKATLAICAKSTVWFESCRGGRQLMMLVVIGRCRRPCPDNECESRIVTKHFAHLRHQATAIHLIEYRARTERERETETFLTPTPPPPPVWQTLATAIIARIE